jgi:hypothetical protein
MIHEKRYGIERYIPKLGIKMCKIIIAYEYKNLNDAQKDAAKLNKAEKGEYKYQAVAL